MSLKRTSTRSCRDGEVCAKRKAAHPSSNEKDMVSTFWSWCVENGMKISSKVQISEKCIHRYGMIANTFIEKSEILFEVPRTLFLWEKNNSESSNLSGLLSLKSESGWVNLLLVLMLETTKGKSSHWWPYMQIVPPTGILDTPIFWPEDARNTILGGTKLHSLVVNDVKNISKEYNEIALPFIEAHANLGFDKGKHTLELFTQLVGFVMAYSFTDPEDGSNDINPPIMVPMADVLNHISKNNAHLQFDEDTWKMVATRNISPNEEVFNTFGFLSNTQLLQMYGFVEEDSSSEMVEIPVAVMKNYANISSLEKKWHYLFHEEDGIFPGCENIVIGTKGILSTEEAKIILKILTMSTSEFSSYDGEEWESDSESDNSDSSDNDVHVITFQSIKMLEGRQKSLLHYACDIVYSELGQLLKEKADLKFIDELNIKRQSKIVILLKGQISILETLLRFCS